MAIVKPAEMNFSNKNIIMILSGLPGVGKTTLALSAPDAVLVDADEGIVRVKPEHRKDCSICKTYEDFLSDIKSFEGVYKTVVIDTMGALIEYMKDWAMRNEPSASKKSGGFSQQGYGFVKTEFLRLSAELRKKFNVIFVFHVAKDKIEDEVFYDIVCEGSAKTLVWQPADLGAYLHIVNGERYLGFTPTTNYNAKSAYGIKGLVKVPELKDGDSNDFLTKLFAVIKENLSKEAASFKNDNVVYEKAIKEGQALVNGINDIEDIDIVTKKLKNIEHALTSHKEITAMFNKRLEELGIKKDPQTKTYVKISDDGKSA